MSGIIYYHLFQNRLGAVVGWALPTLELRDELGRRPAHPARMANPRAFPAERTLTGY
jgi:hypothetical protein